jgi:hypothetical protein
MRQLNKGRANKRASLLEDDNDDNDDDDDDGQFISISTIQNYYSIL